DLKSGDLDVRPIHHRRAHRVRAHVFLCMLAYYVIWRMKRDLAPMLFKDDDRATAAAQRSLPVGDVPTLSTRHQRYRGRDAHCCRPELLRGWALQRGLQLRQRLGGEEG